MLEPYVGLIAGGDINPCRFVKGGSNPHEVVKGAAATDHVIGITADFQKAHPVTGASDVHAASGDPVTVYPRGTVCKLQVGSGGCLAWSRLVSDANGKGVIAATTGTANQFIGAIALEAGSEDEFVTVIVEGMYHRAALS